MARCRPRRSRGMARRGGLLAAAAALAATVSSAAPALDEGVARPGWAEIGWVRVWPIGKAGNGDLLEGSAGPIILVLVVPERVSERAVYLDAGRTLCTTDEMCAVLYLPRIGGPLTSDVLARTEDYSLGAYFGGAGDFEFLHVPCEMARIEGCDP